MKGKAFWMFIAVLLFGGAMFFTYKAGQDSVVIRETITRDTVRPPPITEYLPGKPYPKPYPVPGKTIRDTVWIDWRRDLDSLRNVVRDIKTREEYLAQPFTFSKIFDKGAKVSGIAFPVRKAVNLEYQSPFEVTTTKIQEAGLKFFKGPFIRIGVYGSFKDKVWDMQNKVYPFSIGFALQTEELWITPEIGGAIYPKNVQRMVGDGQYVTETTSDAVMAYGISFFWFPPLGRR